METIGDERVHIDNETGLAQAHALDTPVPCHRTCLGYGNMVGETSFPYLDESGCYTQNAPDHPR
jgi:hypothetical protein